MSQQGGRHFETDKEKGLAEWQENERGEGQGRAKLDDPKDQVRKENVRNEKNTKTNRFLLFIFPENHKYVFYEPKSGNLDIRAPNRKVKTANWAN